MVGLGRLELPTSRLSGVRSNHLSYRPEPRDEPLVRERTGPGCTRRSPLGPARADMERETKTAAVRHF